ncbi:hypothetical protein IZ6_04950 [Terrihabitans soli]|uniref:Uncharacterized protein n=1 Tax=Terrihabitans soli TaxID=708113 RepID=A0A6S6QS97_9HYPH|nr:hypothetical protein [Terrihabitans soli]BCJ89760.1 hypothetical protein IZ6_04950 [Terrihabitans soli]
MDIRPGLVSSEVLYYNIQAMASHTHHHHPRPARGPSGPGFSLLLLSAGQRVLGALILLALLWGGVFWALA